MVLYGIDVLLKERISDLKDQRIGLITNQASLNQNFESSLELFESHSELDLKSILSPQHGFWSEKQDNMIESEDFIHPVFKIPVFSLYGRVRKPTEEMIFQLDTVVFDLQDVGTRVYTYASTMAYAMQACREFNKKFVILDRPNPINGVNIEGCVLNPAFKSFVGLYPIPMRHGLTLGEMATLFNKEYNINADLEVIPLDGWKREMWYDEINKPWMNPSPNMPSLDCAVVYPGTVALEGTNISEGRGTTRPFELFGAPFINPYEVRDRLEKENLPGVFFRPTSFQPVFNKWKEKQCGGLQIHVFDRTSYKPFITGIALIKAVRHLYPENFEWLQPPYEYEYEKLPVDIIYGTDIIRKHIEADSSLKEIEESWQDKLAAYDKLRKNFLLY